MDTAGRHEFPDNPAELAKLAYLIGSPNPRALEEEVEQTFREMRSRFEEIFS